MDGFLAILQETWAIRALLASSLVGIMCGVLGCFIVLRNMALIGDALSHAILPGVAFAFLFVGYSALGFFLGSIIAGFITAVAITWIQANVDTKNDAVIGIVFTAMYSIGVIVISGVTREGVHLDLKDFLIGNVLGVSNEDLYLTSFITLYVLVSVVVLYRYLFISTFQPVIAETMGISVKLLHYALMLLLSFAVVAALRMVGIILVVAMLITPSSAALLFTNRMQWVLVLSGIIGAFSGAFGLVISIYFDTTPGPVMCLVASLVYLSGVVFSPNKGLIVKFIHRRRLRIKILREDIMKGAYRLQQRGEFSFEKLSERLDISKRMLNRQLSILQQKKWITNRSEDQFQLSELGEEVATRMVRAHRLWETYLSEKVGLGEDQIHEDAENMEHILDEAMLDEVDQTLGFPTMDPHGSPIPSKKGRPKQGLHQLKAGERAVLSLRQPNESVSAKLWNLGLYPAQVFEIVKIDSEGYLLKQKERTIKVASALSKQVNVEMKSFDPSGSL